MTTERKRVRARWVFPVDQPPIENGTIEWQGDTITEVTALAMDDTEDLGNVAIIPGLVNCHAHLEFSKLSQPVEPATPFTSWIKSLVGYRIANSEQLSSAIQLGCEESLNSGVTALGEIDTGNWSSNLPSPRPKTILFRECIGLSQARQIEQLDLARGHLREFEKELDLRPGLSPHAPYSVHFDLYRELVSLAADRDNPLAIHLAETEAELELITKGTGEFVELLKTFGVWENDLFPTGSLLDYLQPLAELSHPLIIHGNYLDGECLDWLSQHPQVSIVYCPRTHSYFEHKPHPWQRLQDRGIPVALGTDGRGSNPDLSLWREVQFLHRQFGFQTHPQTFLEMATQTGAQALGVVHEAGSLTPGKSANFVTLSLPDSGSNDPWKLLFSQATQPEQTCLQGRWLK